MMTIEETKQSQSHGGPVYARISGVPLDWRESSKVKFARRARLSEMVCV